VHELFPDVNDDKRPGVILAGACGKECIAQKQFAEKCGICCEATKRIVSAGKNKFQFVQCVNNIPELPY